MKTITTYYDNDLYTVTVDNNTTLERLEMTFRTPVSLKEAVKTAKKYMREMDYGEDDVTAYVTNSYTGEVLAEIEKRA